MTHPHKEPGQSRFTGQSLQRREDPRLLTGRGCYTADIRLHGMLQAAFLRSPHAHARIVSIDTTVARSMPGVAAVYTAADLAGRVTPLAAAYDPPARDWAAVTAFSRTDPRPPVLAAAEALYVGQTVAMVVAESRALAEDARDTIVVEWDPVPAAVDPVQALQPGAAQAHPEVPGNVMYRMKTGKGDCAAALNAAPHRHAADLYHHRYSGIPIETRATLCDWDERRNVMRGWFSGQSAHHKRKALAECLGLPYENVEVQIPDVGGGFGPKILTYAEDVAVAFAAMALARPVQWVEDRTEHFQATYHARDQRHHVEFGFDDNGRLLALRTQAVVDCGAFNLIGLIEIANGAVHLPGPYRFDHYEITATGVCTNKTPHYVYRGAGRPEVCFVIERVMDRIAQHLGLDPAEVRRRNTIPAAAMPFAQGLVYRDGAPVVYDSGDYPQCLEKALAAIGYDEIRRQQPEWWRQGRCVGVGIASYVEGTGAGPFMGARLRIDPKGNIVVITDAVSQGQGHDITLAQITADLWGVTPDDVVVIEGDSVRLPYGTGSSASRTVVVAGSAIHGASRKLQDKVRLLAAHMLEAGPDDLEIAGGRVFPKGAPFRGLTLAQLAQAAAPGPGFKGPPGLDPDLDITHYHVPASVTWSNATQVAMVEVDAETGKVTVPRMAVAHDAGVIVNPRLADGQVAGGVVQGLGGALFEELRYDESGQLLTGTFMDYLMPTAVDAPAFILVHMETPSPLNPLGVKGLGEGGAIAPPAAVAAAVEDALRPWGVRVNRTPIDPGDLVAQIAAARREQ